MTRRSRSSLLLALVFLASAMPAAAQPVQVVHRFQESPAFPNGPLVQVPDGTFYGVTQAGIIRLSTGGQVTEVARFDDAVPQGALVLAPDGGLYGSARSRWPPPAGRGSIFRFDPTTGALRTVHTFRSPAEGRDPLGGLVAVGGSLYGVTRNGAGPDENGTIFHVVVATGQVVTDHVFPPSPSTAPREPASPLVLAPDGLLYGTAGEPGSGVIYRFDPAGGAVILLHELTAAEGASPGALLLGADGRLYGSAFGGGLEGAGTIFRYTPATDLFERLYSLMPSNGTDGRYPGPLEAGGDGHFYGVTDYRGQGFTFPEQGGTLFRLRAGLGGTFTYETIGLLDRAVAGIPFQAKLTRGADGLLYGFAQQAGPTLAAAPHGVLGGPTFHPGPGTLFRFDPAEGGPPSNPIALTVLHAFPMLTQWHPSTPTPAADGFLYGVTSAGGPANRGAVYRLNPATGAVTMLGDLPGAETRKAVNSALVEGPDGLLYGTTAAFFDPSTAPFVRVNPSSGIATGAGSGVGSADLVRTPAGALYGAYTNGPRGIMRFDPATNTVAIVAQLLISASLSISPVTATSDGRVYAIAQTSLSGGATVRTTLVRLNPSGFDADELVLADDINSFGVDRLVEGLDGATYLAAMYRETAAVLAVDRNTGAVRRVCTVPTVTRRVEHLSAGPDGALYGFVTDVTQRLFRCDPATGAVAITVLPPDIGQVVEPLRSAGGMLYGATRSPLQTGGGAIIRLAPGGTLPALDSDGDGLPNLWETAYRLDPFGTGAGSAAGDDPDGDGRTNAQELAEGSHPRGPVTRLFAEGATGPFFRTRFDITSPGVIPATVRARFLTDTGVVVGADLVVPPLSHIDFDPATLPALANATFSTIIESDTDVAVDRTMTWGVNGYGSHLETGLAAPSTTWYFAEGSTSGEFALFYLLQNPHATAVAATVTYLRPSGLPPIVRSYTLPPNSRTTIAVDAETAELASTDVSAAIAAALPIVAERAMYLTRPGQIFAAGHESAGVTAPALDWFFAEGATGTFFDLFVLIANPGSTPAAVEVEYLGAGGSSLTKTYTVAPQSRMTIWVDDEELPAGSGLKPLASGSVSTVVRSTNGVPIIAERAMWWPGPEITGSYWYEAHNSPGATGTATRWVLGGAEIGGSDGADTYVLIANATATAGRAQIWVVDDDYLARSLTLDLPAKSRTTVSLATGLAFPIEGRVGVIVESLGATPVPIVVERATYSSPGGAFWGSGGNALAAALP